MFENLDRWSESVIDDTTHMRLPVVGDRLRSFPDTLEVTEVSEPLTRDGKTDRLLRLKVVEVHSPEDTIGLGEEFELLYGDLRNDSMGEQEYQYLDEIETEEIECSRCGGDGLVVSEGPHPSICVGVLATDPCPECA